VNPINPILIRQHYINVIMASKFKNKKIERKNKIWKVSMYV